MDLIELLRQHQIALIGAREGKGRSDECLVGHYARRIVSLRNEFGFEHFGLFAPDDDRRATGKERIAGGIRA